MYFGIRGKVALLVIIATAASALLVATLLTKRATEVLREHELVDLGDEASLKGWVTIDQIEGLRDDLINIAFSPTFQDDVAAEKTQEHLLSMARGLCRRNWDSHLRVDLLTFDGEEVETTLIAEKATLDADDLWFPEPDAKAGERLHLSPIQRLYVTRKDLPGRDELSRWEPVVWAVAPLDQYGKNTGGKPTFVRILMTLFTESSPRHLFAMENADGAQLIRHDEHDPLERGNDAVFLSLSESPELKEALLKREEERNSPDRTEETPKVDRLVRMEDVKLASPYYFQEGSPREELRGALLAIGEDKLDEILERLQIEIESIGKVGGLSRGVKEVRLLARSRESIDELRNIVEAALRTETEDLAGRIDWRNVVECDEIHSWAVKLVVGPGEDHREYLIHYAVLDDELASSIEYEMQEVRSVALLIAAAFGVIGFLIAMLFIRPLRLMTRTAQKITDTHSEALLSQVAGMARRLDIKRRDEVGDIARASKRLFEELIASQEHLEKRVNERTRELRRANTEMEKANEKLMSLSHEKDAFVAKISHDLRQPLNAIFLQVEALKLSELDDGQKKDVERIHAHAARELNLVNDILEYQKIIMGAETLNKDEIDISKLFQDIEEAHKPGLDAKGVGFTIRQDEEVNLITADDRRLRQILGNLVGNACKFTKEGEVTLEGRSREINNEPWVEFTITDTGRGMSPKEQAKAFVPFVSNKKDNAGGSGLGLSICKELVGQMGGRIGFVSELDKGTHFSVFLPITPSSEHYEPKLDNPTILANGNPLNSETASLPRDATILVIDDDVAVRDLLKRIFEAEGYHVITAGDGNSGLELANQHLPDAITLDVVMPGGKDGWDVLQQLKGSARTQSIPVIMVSVMAEQENGLALDVEDYLVKPIDVDRLSRVILRVTGQSPQRNLLLVDDDTESLAAMSRVLESSGWQTILAHDGAEALQMLEKTRPAAIVLDLIMPGMDGFEFLQHVQEAEHLKSIPVIVMTGQEPSETEKEFLRRRVTTVLKKGKHAASNLVTSINTRIRSNEDARTS
ncbi:MAG: response regulator [Verrucomicrobiales bacterium]|nr:response regulator [Verrucomicrobiales bacterium]